MIREFELRNVIEEGGTSASPKRTIQWETGHFLEVRQLTEFLKLIAD